MSDRGDPHHEHESQGPAGPGIPGLDLPLDGQAGPARALSPAALRAMVASAVDAWPGPELGEPTSPDPSPLEGPPPAPPTSAPGLATKPFLLGAAVATAACLATVATVLSVVRVEPASTPTATVETATVETATVDTATVETATVETATVDTATVDTATVDTATVDTATVDTATVDPTDARGRPSSEREAPTRALARQREGAPPSRAGEDLLERANRLRGAGNFHEADAVYERVTREHRGTFAAYVAEVASASLHLEQLGDPRGAAQRFARARRMRPGGALDLEALDGVARAQRALGDREAERDALRTLVARHPGSSAATRASSRLADLEAPSR